MIYDDFVAMLEAAAIESVSIVHQYKLQKDRDDNGIFAFFEGDEDKLIYSPHIRNRSDGRKVYMHICDGKDGVLEVFDEVGDDDGCLLFFVDRDYDDLVGEGNNFGEKVFVTKWYSAESYLVTKDAIEILWDDFVPLPKDDRLAAFVQDYVKKSSEFSKSMLPITSLILSLRQCGEKVILKDMQIKAMVHIDERGVFARKKEAINEIKRCHRPSPSGSADIYEILRESTRWAKTLKELDPLVWIRGKFYLWFLGEYASRRWKDIQKSIQKGKRKAVIPVGISQNKIFETLGARVYCSPELVEYLDRNMRLS